MSFTPSGLREIGQPRGRVVVIDVLRACTTMTHALSQGCRAIYPCVTVGGARRLLRQNARGPGKHQVLLGGERHGLRPRGFHLGNSPAEYSSDMVSGKVVIFTSTNCTRNLLTLRGRKEVIICSLINLPGVAEYLLGGDGDVLLALSGTDGQMSLEDTVCGGMLVYTLLQRRVASLSDSARTALVLYQHYRRKIRQALLDSVHGKRLLELGFRDDVYFCAEVGRYNNIVPRYVRGRVVL